MKILQSAQITIFGFILILIAAANALSAGGDLDTTFNAGVAGFGSYASVVAVQSDGRVLIGGGFSVVNGRSFNRLARLNADGSIDQSFSVGAGFGTGSSVNAIAVQTDGKILVGGLFVDYNGATINYLARLNADGTLDTNFNSGGSGPNSSVNAIVLQPNGQILIAGAFSQFNGATANGFARLNSNGSLDTAFAANLGTGFSGGQTYSMVVQSNGQIVVGGTFNDLNGAAANYIVRLNQNGTRDTAFTTNGGTGFNLYVYSLALQTNGKLLVGGSFFSFNGTPRQSLARLNTNGSLDTSFASAVSNSAAVQSIIIQTDGRIVAAGQSLFFGAGFERRDVGRVNGSDGSLDLSFDVGTGASSAAVSSLALQLDGTIFAAGNFSTFNGVTRSCLVKLNTDGSVNASFTTVIGLPAQVYAALVQGDNKILIGGDFRGANESFRDSFARINADGTTDSTFVPALNTGGSGVIYAIAEQSDGQILVGGAFYKNINFNDYGIARLNTDGSIDSSFNASTNGTVNAIAVQTNGKILIGGNFTSVNGTNGINNIARLNSNGSIDSTFNLGTGFDSSVEDIIVQSNGQIIVGGSFTAYNGTNGVNHIARLNSGGTLDSAFKTNTGAGFDSTVLTLALQANGRILAGGFFGNFDAVSSPRIARLNSNGTRDASFNVGTGFNNLVSDLALQPDGRILAVGAFSDFNTIGRLALARINTDGSLDSSFHSDAASFTNLETVGLQSDGRIIIGGNLQSYDNTPRFGIARISAGDTITWTGAADSNWNNGANWTGGNVPTSADNAIIPNNANVNINGGDFAVLTLTVGTGATLSIAGGCSLTIEGGTNNGTIAGAGTLDFTGASLGNNGTISVAAVNAQTGTSSNKALTGGGSFVGNILTIEFGATLSLQSNHQFNQINLQGNLDATSRTVSLRGANPLQGFGTIFTTFGTIVFDGATAQTVSSSVIYNNLTINNASGVTFDGISDSSVNGTLNLANGILSVQTAYSLSLADGATAVRTNGYAIGRITKTFLSPQPAFTYPLGSASGYSPVTVNIQSGTGSLTASVVATNHPSLDPATSLHRFWRFETGSAFTANLTFNYLQPDVFGNESNYRITRIFPTGGSARVFANNCAGGSPCVNTGANIANISGASDFYADWTLSELAPTAANVSIGGRIVSAEGKAIGKVTVTLTAPNGEIRSAKTNPFGYYRFDGLSAGETCVVSVRHKQFDFNPDSIVINAVENLENIDFIAVERRSKNEKNIRY